MSRFVAQEPPARPAGVAISRLALAGARLWLAVSYAGVGDGVGTDEGELAQAGFGGGTCIGASRGEISMGGGPEEGW